jgi:hypothetical protein
VFVYCSVLSSVVFVYCSVLSSVVFVYCSVLSSVVKCSVPSSVVYHLVYRLV